jgi:hypothetical protein
MIFYLSRFSSKQITGEDGESIVSSNRAAEQRQKPEAIPIRRESFRSQFGSLAE